MKNLNKFVCLIIILVLFLSYFYSPTPKYFNSTRLQVLNIFYYPFSFLSNIYESLGAMFNIAAITEKNKELRSRISKLNIEIHRLKSLRRENERLREMLNLKNKLSFDTVPAEVIGREKNDLTNSIIISKGSKEGLKKYYGIVAKGGLVGKISEITSRISKITLLDDVNFKIIARIDSTGEIGMVKGSIEKNFCYMNYIPKDSDVQKGALIVTSSQNKYIPGGIPIGKVKGFVNSESEFFKKAIINTHTNLENLHFVLCVKVR